MKIIITIVFLLMGHVTIMAQTPIVGSKVQHKDFKEIVWLTSNEISSEKVTLVEFYLDENPSCRQILDSILLPTIDKRPDIQVIIISRKESPIFAEVIERYPTINIGIDTQGSALRKLGVKYVPLTIIIGQDSKIKWRGTLNHAILRSMIITQTTL